MWIFCISWVSGCAEKGQPLPGAVSGPRRWTRGARNRIFGAGVVHEKMRPIRFVAGTVRAVFLLGPLAVSDKLMKFFKVFFALVVVALACAPSADAQTRLGAQGPEAAPNRRQQWLVPSPEPDAAVPAVLFRPAGEGPFPLALIAHDSTQNALRRAEMPQPEYRALAAWLVARGYAVLVPERPGHGATGGKYLEDQGGCDDANYSRAGYATADSIKAALSYLRDQPFIRPGGAVILGHSAGAWGALALAGEDPKAVAAIIAFAPGRGGHANDQPNQVCAPRTLMSSAGEFGEDAQVPVTWLVATNDSYFTPEFSRQMADAFKAGGDKVDFRVLPAFGSEGHGLAEADGGERIFGPALEGVIKPEVTKSAGKR
jgi:dienelactone hydrolase